MPDDRSIALAELAIRHMEQLLSARVAPPLPPELASCESMEHLHAGVLAWREYMTLLANGDISQEIPMRGFLAGLLKAHIANLRHLTWQVEQISKGDFTQRIDFLGDFSASFNNMVVQLDNSITSLTATQDSLTELTKTLRQEVELRSAAVYALKQSKARFKYLADHDPLTGALNRRSFLRLAEAGLKQALATGTSCCLAMLDVDHFKRFNDTFGHVDGDAALKHVVSIGTASLRQQDSMGRYGGEEFLFFFAEADITIGMQVAERILNAIRQKPVNTSTGPAPITASMGVYAVLPEWPGERNGQYLQKAIALADEALYQAKQSGRDRACAATLRPPGEPGGSAAKKTAKAAPAKKKSGSAKTAPAAEKKTRGTGKTRAASTDG